MGENMYLCHQCGNIFRLLPDNGNNCPQCGSSQTRELPSWVPMGSDLSEGQTKWHYECQQCKKKFELPVPSSPSQEKGIKCPACKGSHIHRLTLSGYEPLYCG
jgi:DNA-directed RNA polymerase subunit RPC12/RpoP